MPSGLQQYLFSAQIIVYMHIIYSTQYIEITLPVRLRTNRNIHRNNTIKQSINGLYALFYHFILIADECFITELEILHH